MWTLHKLTSNKRKRHSTDFTTDLQTIPPIDQDNQRTSSKSAEDERSILKNNDAPEIYQQYMISPWDFSQEDLKMFPALCKRNFWCIQRHQARALHYDLRMQLDGTTFSWAIPRGLLGISKTGEKNRLAVETTLHPISYTTYEGGDGRILPSGERCGTLLWDVGTYTIDYPWKNNDSDSENEKRRRRKRKGGREEDSDDPLGKHEEDKFRMAMQRPVRVGKSRSIHFTLKGGRKMDNHSYILIQSPQNSLNKTFSSTGRQKVNWFISLPKGIEGYSWGEEGEEGEKYGRSVKTGRTLREVCAAKERIVTFGNEQERFGKWAGDLFEVGGGDAGDGKGKIETGRSKRRKVAT